MKVKILIGKLIEYTVLAGVVTFLGLVFLFEILDLFIVRPIYQKYFGKRRRKKPRRTPRRVSK